MTEGHLVLSVVGTPHMCPAAPLEFVFMADSWFRQRGLRDDIEITYTYPINRVHGNPHIGEWAAPIMAERDINTETFFNAESSTRTRRRSPPWRGTELDYDLLAAIPPPRGVDVVDEAGLGDRGWVDVDKHTLEAETADNVYALGDAATTGVPKAGSVAHYQAGIVAQRLESEIRGGPRPRRTTERRSVSSRRGWTRRRSSSSTTRIRRRPRRPREAPLVEAGVQRVLLAHRTGLL